MLENIKLKHVKVCGKGSHYPNKVGKQRLGYAFYYIVDIQKKKRKTIAGNSKEELEKKAIAFLEKLDRDYEEKQKQVQEEISKLENISFRNVADMYFNEYKERMNSKKKAISYSSVEGKACVLKNIYEFLGDMPISDITNETAEELLDWASVKKDGTYYSKSHVDKLQQAFLQVMQYGREKGFCSNEINKIELDDKLTKVDTDARFLDKQHLAKLLDAVKDNQRYHLLVRVLIATGLRQEEAFALHIDDFREHDNYVEVIIDKTVVETDSRVYKLVEKTKTERSKRKIPIPVDVYEEVKKYYYDMINNELYEEKIMRVENGTEGMIFLDQKKNVINKRIFQRNFKRYIQRRLGNDCDTTLHMLRHSYASLQAGNLPAHKVAKMLGDSQQTVEKNYYSLSNDDKEEITKNITSIIDSISGF